MRPRDLEVSALDLRRWGWLLVALLALFLGTSSAAAHATSTLAINVGESSCEQLAHGARVCGYDDRAQQVLRSPAAPHLVLRLRDAPPTPVVGSAAQPSLWPASGVAAEAAGGGAAKAEQYVYRVHGGDSGPMGHSWTPENPMGMANPRGELGLPKVNSGQQLTRARVTDMEGVMKRDALPLDGNPGGAPEWLFPDPLSQLEVHWTIPLVPPW